MVVANDGVNGNDIETISSTIEMENHDGDMVLDTWTIRIKQECDILSQEDLDSLASLLEEVGTYGVQQNSFRVQNSFWSDPGARKVGPLENWVSQNSEFLTLDQNWSHKMI